MNNNKILFFILLFLAFCFPRLLAQQSENTIDRSKVSDLFQNELYAEAIQYLLNKNVSSSSDISSLNTLGYAYFMSEQYNEAQQQYSRVLLLDSLNFTANRYSALLSKHFKDYRTQLFYYQRLLRIQPLNAGLHKLTGDTYIVLKQPDSALMNYAKAYNLQPFNETIAYTYADNLLDGELYESTDKVTTAFLLKDSTNVPIMKLAIKSYSSQRKMQKVAAFTNRWIASNEIDTKITINLALANYALNNYQECFRVCDILLQQGIETESLYYYASQAKNKLREFKKSNELLKQCLKLAISENTNTYYFSVAENFEALKDYKKAINNYDTAYYLFKKPLALYNIARLYDQFLNNATLANQYYKRYLVLAKPQSSEEKRVYAYVKELFEQKKK
jgi:tetratricopeptide (TPR) repeat protein